MSLPYQVRGFIFLLYKSSRPSSIKPYTACLFKRPFPFKWHSQESSRQHSQGMEERAPSTAQEFERVAEEKEKLKLAEQGVASQTSDKVYDGAEEATIGDSKVESVKRRFEEHEERADCRRRGEDQDEPT